MKNYTKLFLVLSLIPFTLSAQPEKSVNLKVGTNFRIYPSSFSQTEVFIVNHPNYQNILFASANTWNPADFFISEGVYVSTNTGTNWFGSDTCKGEPINFHGGDPGITIDKNGRFILTRLSGIVGGGLFSHYSDNLGQTWSLQKSIFADNIVERATVTSDIEPASNFYGRTYATWVKSEGQFPVMVTFTDDGAENWSQPITINNPDQKCSGGDVKVGDNGILYVCWAARIDNSPYTEDYVGFGFSTNGGTNWTITENVFDINGITGILNTKGNIRVNGLPRMAVDLSGGSRHGWIYIVTTQRNLSPAGSDPDVILNRSTDGGLTWSPGIRVNQDALNNGKVQYFPAIHIDEFGGVNVLFYDDRNTTIDSTGVFLARSDDGGISWREFEISDHNFKPVPLAGLSQGYQGDNIDITSTNEILFPVWMDNSTGIYQIWTAPTEISSVGIQEPSMLIPEGFELKQNYPNPFNPATHIEFQISNSGFTNLKVYDILGNEIATLFNEETISGSYEVEFSSAGLSSGMYIYKLNHNGKYQTKSMLLLK